MDIFLKLVMIGCVIGLLRTSEGFCQMSREVDERVYVALKRFMLAAEESGFPREIVPVLLVLTALTFMLVASTMAGGR